MEGRAGHVNCVAVTPDGKPAVSGGADGILCVRNIQGGETIGCFEGHANDVTCVAVSPDGLRAVSGGKDKTARVWSPNGFE